MPFFEILRFGGGWGDGLSPFFSDIFSHQNLEREVGGLPLPHEDTSVPLFSFTNLYLCLSFLSLYITNHCLLFQGRVTGDPTYRWLHCSFKEALEEVWRPAAKGNLGCVFLFFIFFIHIFPPEILSTWNPGEVQFRRNSQRPRLNLSTHIKAAF